MPVWELIICGPARVDTNHPWYTHPVVRNPDTPNKRGLTGEQRYFNLFSHPRSAMREAKLTSDFIRKMTALEKELQGKTYLVGERFTVCDLNICAYLAWVRHLGEDALRPFPNIKNWPLPFLPLIYFLSNSLGTFRFVIYLFIGKVS